MVGLDGKVRNIPAYMKDELVTKGWRVVINPKQEYYPDRDQTIKSNTVFNNLEEVVETDLLTVEKL